jgi:hypothetical protein
MASLVSNEAFLGLTIAAQVFWTPLAQFSYLRVGLEMLSYFDMVSVHECPQLLPEWLFRNIVVFMLFSQRAI